MIYVSGFNSHVIRRVLMAYRVTCSPEWCIANYAAIRSLAAASLWAKRDKQSWLREVRELMAVDYLLVGL